MDANGRAPVWLDPSLSYKFVLKDSSDVTIYTEDGVIGTLTADAVTTTSILNGAVTTPKLADDSVTAAKLADDPSVDANRAVTTNHIRDLAVDIRKIANAALAVKGLFNISLSATVGSNALTLAIKDATAATASATSPVKISFRNSPATDGALSIRSLAAALSITVPTSATLGHVSGKDQYVWFYALDSAGTIKIAVSGVKVFDDNSIQSTTAISVASTSGSVLYSDAVYSNVAIRLIGRLLVNQATAGTWASAPTEIALGVTPVPTMSEETSFAPVSSWTANTTATGWWRRIGGYCRGQVTLAFSGAPTAAILTVNLPQTVDTARLTSGSTVNHPLGGFSNANDSGNGKHIQFLLNTSTQGKVVYQDSTTSAQSILTDTVPISWGNGDSITVGFDFPVVGWSTYGP